MMVSRLSGDTHDQSALEERCGERQNSKVERREAVRDLRVGVQG